MLALSVTTRTWSMLAGLTGLNKYLSCLEVCQLSLSENRQQALSECWRDDISQASELETSYYIFILRQRGRKDLIGSTNIPFPLQLFRYSTPASQPSHPQQDKGDSDWEPRHCCQSTQRAQFRINSEEWGRGEYCILCRPGWKSASLDVRLTI